MSEDTLSGTLRRRFSRNILHALRPHIPLETPFRIPRSPVGERREEPAPLLPCVSLKSLRPAAARRGNAASLRPFSEAAASVVEICNQFVQLGQQRRVALTRIRAQTLRIMIKVEQKRLHALLVQF